MPTPLDSARSADDIVCPESHRNLLTHRHDSRMMVGFGRTEVKQEQTLEFTASPDHDNVHMRQKPMMMVQPPERQSQLILEKPL